MHRCVIPASEVAKKYPALFVRNSMDARVCIDITKDDDLVIESEQVY